MDLWEDAKKWFESFGYDVDRMLSSGEIDKNTIVASYQRYLAENFSCE